MILSYHPCVEADKNLLCAGRKPDVDDLAAIKSADAVILPQGCYESLYKMAHDNCRHIFPNFDARFKYSGKIGQIRLFQKTDVAHPKTELYLNLDSFSKRYGAFPQKPDLDFPFVFKFDWGGEGDLVHLIHSVAEFEKVMQIARTFEQSGQSGFLLQEYIHTKNRSLRVAVIGQTYISYWRIQKDTEIFGTSLAAGAVIDADAEPKLQADAIKSVRNFCNKTDINLAGIDILFPSEIEKRAPLFLEINYYFGRRGLSGSENFYNILNSEIKKWIGSLDLS